ncbi:MAG: hypothetical protein IPM24_05240 [Bryobacterales bacterium]|nr:hypothetical protein [Bryobacterales bacterium]
MMFRGLSWMLALLALVLTVHASAVRDQRATDRDSRAAKKQGSVSRVEPVFSLSDREVIRDYYRNRRVGLPPGLAKREGALPPGLKRHLERDGTLPPGLQKRVVPFPPELNLRLQALPRGYSRGLVDGSAVIINRRTRSIADVIHNLLDPSFE